MSLVTSVVRNCLVLGLWESYLVLWVQVIEHVLPFRVSASLFVNHQIVWNLGSGGFIILCGHACISWELSSVMANASSAALVGFDTWVCFTGWAIVGLSLHLGPLSKSNRCLAELALALEFVVIALHLTGHLVDGLTCHHRHVYSSTVVPLVELSLDHWHRIVWSKAFEEMLITHHHSVPVDVWNHWVVLVRNDLALVSWIMGALIIHLLSLLGIDELAFVLSLLSSFY